MELQESPGKVQVEKLGVKHQRMTKLRVMTVKV